MNAGIGVTDSTHLAYRKGKSCVLERLLHVALAKIAEITSVREASAIAD